MVIIGILMALFVADIHCVSVGTTRSSTIGRRRQQLNCLGVNISETSREGRRLDHLDNEAVGVLFAGQMAFSVHLFKVIHSGANLRDQKIRDNVFVSPMSIYSALLLTYFGSMNNTENQLADVLGIGRVDKVRITQAYKLMKFTRQLMREAGLVKYDLDVANRAYFDQTEEVRECMKDIFDDDLEMLDFAGDSQSARARINAWIYQLTRGKIQDLATPDNVDSNTRMALVNAAYFKGQWMSQFKSASTRSNNFFMKNNQVGAVNMMFQKGRYRLGVSEELQARVLEIPYLGEDVSFYAVLPEATSLDETLELLTLDKLKAVMFDMFPVTVEIGIPKFSMETTTNLGPVLSQMGLVDLFDASTADLSGFSGQRGLSISAATHKAFIEVNEEGSEAAAATLLVSLRMARPLEASKFICDRPFLFYIYDNLSESILFMGAFENPK